MSKLQMLLEQTEFLLGKQKEAKQECSRIFADLLKRIEQKISSNNHQPAEVEELESIHDMLAGQAQQLLNESQEDIDFLSEQLHALQDIAKIQNPQKAQELLNMIIDPSEELLETEEFIQSVQEEVAASQESFVAIIDDINSALQEGDINSVRAMLEAMAQEGQDLTIDMSGEEDLTEDEDGCCGSGACSTGGGCGSCPSKCGAADEGADIFKAFSKYDQDLAKDMVNDEERKKK